MKRGIAYFYCYNANSKSESFSIVFSKNSSSLSKLETRNSKLETRNSILDSRKHRVSRIEFRVETVNLHLTGTVCAWLILSYSTCLNVSNAVCKEGWS